MATNNVVNNQWLNTQTVTTDTFQIVNNTFYLNSNATPANLSVYTLPLTAKVGDIIAFQNFTAGGFKIEQNAGQSIVLTAATKTTVGVAGSYTQTDLNFTSTFMAMCTVANTTWTIMIMQSAGPVFA